MTIFLTSSPTGPLDKCRDADHLDEKNYFVQNLKKYWRPASRCLLIAADPDICVINDGMADSLGRAMKNSGLSVAAFDLWDSRTSDTSREILHTYDVVILGGGHVPTQNRYFQKLALKEKLQGFEGILIGISAGTMNSADEVYAQPELPGEAVDPAYARFIRGLGLTKTRILPHYQLIKEAELDGQRVMEDITYGDSFGKKFLALPDGSYLLIEGETETVWGEAYQIEDGILSILCLEGEKHAI